MIIYGIQFHMGLFRYLRIKPHPCGDATANVTADANAWEAYNELGFAHLPQETSIADTTQDGVLKVGLTEGDALVEYTWALIGQLTLNPFVRAIAPCVIRPNMGQDRSYRVVITKDPGLYPLGMKV